MIKKFHQKKASTEKDIDAFYQAVMEKARQENIDFIFCAYNKEKGINVTFARGSRKRLFDFYKALKYKYKLYEH